MAAHGLCRRLVELAGADQFAITIYGDEPRPAYDRVNLSKLLSGKSEDDLLLSPMQWYQDHRIELVTGRRIARLELDRQQIWDDAGGCAAYDKLVLATGSRPWVPPIPGANSPGVFVYRTIDDLNAIQDYVRTLNCKSSAVIGGGLLGLEAAKVMHDMGLAATILEVAPGLMPRQLDAQGASVLRDRVQSLGVDVHVTRRTKCVTSVDAAVQIDFDNAQSLTVDILLIAAGIRPRDELARESGLAIGPRGGIAVNDLLETDTPNVFAIGECAAVNGNLYGLVAPCYRMADVLAERLVGETTVFAGVVESVELKLLGVPVIGLGKAIGESTSGVVIKYESDEGYRKILLEQGRVVGAACVGSWDDLNLIRLAVGEQKWLWPIQRSRFLRTGSPYAAGSGLSIHQWPETATVCSCHGVTRGDLGTAINAGRDTVSALSAATGAATACGSCRSLLCELVGARPETVSTRGARTVLVASLLAIVIIVLMATVPSLAFASSVQDEWRSIDVLWRDGFTKQVTGFTLVAILLATVAFSVRKRTIRIGHYGLWRAMHTALGTSMLLGLIAHTGIRMGSNLNFALSFTFLALTFLGGLAGVATSVESSLSGGAAMFVRSWRPKLTWMHIALFVPFPALLAGHVFSVYWY